jgi:carbamoyltransferase
MLLVAPVQPHRCLEFDKSPDKSLFEIVRQPRSDVPAITHVNYSARVQSVHQGDHATYYDTINAFRELTGYGVIVNTSFNVRGEPIVCSPYDAYRCFMRTEMDVLILGDNLLLKEEQPEWPESKGHLEKYDPDADFANTSGPTDKALRQIFLDEFLPVARQSQNGAAGQRISFDVQNKASNWLEYPADQSPGEIFEIPPALSASNPDPEVMAETMMRFWQDSQVNAALLPVVKKLLKLGCEEMTLSEEEEIVEDVSEFIYVMY